MEEISVFWLMTGGFVILLAVRGLITELYNKRMASNGYVHELNDVLNKDEYRVKGRFE